jgi:CDI immunity proteins
MEISFDRKSTLAQLEDRDFGEPEFGSSLVETAHKLYRQPLSEFTVEDLRLMIGQGIGLPFLVPLGIEVLERDALAGGDYHPGDLLLAVLRISKDFWKEHQELYWRVYELVADLPGILRDLIQAIDRFQAEKPSA